MKPFEQYIADAAARYGGVNLLFERGMYSLMDDLERIVKVLAEAGVAFEVIGGVAVNAYVTAVHPARAVGTLNIDLLVQREDLDAIVAAAQRAGYSARRIMGGHMLILPNQHPKEAIHLQFVGERPKSTYPAANPVLSPEFMTVGQYGITVPIAPICDLVRMKLNSFRPKDQVHLEALDECGLITSDVEAQLPNELHERLSSLRRQYSDDEFAEE
ncbi:MAG: hypothetical protein IT168_19730 [Bryobacterales bacterium]|nr:hypothetical protein [Bryobacterales bacterium]